MKNDKSVYNCTTVHFRIGVKKSVIDLTNAPMVMQQPLSGRAAPDETHVKELKSGIDDVSLSNLPVKGKKVFE
ncbi:hypothetical protein [uncultured Bartonella sp.]|uniref:hypothetical protein n=1 Tax=uncultured Bartonella sp. TaxID=104108 RepID=UPI002601309B|nr:hypothetical protein [uncultured Bartonella sp.]